MTKNNQPHLENLKSNMPDKQNPQFTHETHKNNPM